LLPVVILTSSDEERDRLKSDENGANSFVHKSVDFAETVARLGVYWRVLACIGWPLTNRHRSIEDDMRTRMNLFGRVVREERVGWEKRSVPNIATFERGMLGTLRFAQPTKPTKAA
jgi:hypothetical protein